jgi:hypothetical protein
MNKVVFLLVFLCLACWAHSEAMALGMEHFGNAPLNEANYREFKGAMPLVNHESRVYHCWVNGNEKFFYRGDTETLNNALRMFAATESKVHEVVLRPAPGVAHSFNRTKVIPFNWSLHIVGGIAQHQTTLDKGSKVWSRHPVMSVYAGGSIDLEKIKIPEGVTVLELSDLSKRCLQGLESTDKTVRGWGAGVLARLDPYNSKSMTAIARLLEDEDNWVRLNAAGALAVFGKKAKSVVPALRACSTTDDERLKAHAQKVIEEIGRAEDTSMAERKHREILRRISRFRNSLRQHESRDVETAPRLQELPVVVMSGESAAVAIPQQQPSALAAYSMTAGKWSLYTAPKGVRVTPITGGHVFGLSMQGDEIPIIELAAFSPKTAQWHRQRLDVPTTETVQPVVEDWVIGVNVDGRAYAFSGLTGNWDMTDADEPVRVEKDKAFARNHGKTSVFNAETGKWTGTGDSNTTGGSYSTGGSYYSSGSHTG